MLHGQHGPRHGPEALEFQRGRSLEHDLVNALADPDHGLGAGIPHLPDLGPLVAFRGALGVVGRQPPVIVLPIVAGLLVLQVLGKGREQFLGVFLGHAMPERHPIHVFPAGGVRVQEIVPGDVLKLDSLVGDALHRLALGVHHGQPVGVGHGLQLRDVAHTDHGTAREQVIQHRAAAHHVKARSVDAVGQPTVQKLGNGQRHRVLRLPALAHVRLGRDVVDGLPQDLGVAPQDVEAPFALVFLALQHVALEGRAGVLPPVLLALGGCLDLGQPRLGRPELGLFAGRAHVLGLVLGFLHVRLPKSYRGPRQSRQNRHGRPHTRPRTGR